MNFCQRRTRISQKSLEAETFIKKIGNGLDGGQIVSTVMWQQKVNDYSKKL